MEKPITLLEHLLKDASEQCSTVYDSRDMATIKRRIGDEGWSFVAITLPAFLESMMNALERGSVTQHDFVGWRKHGRLPVFLQGFLQHIFCEEGMLKDESVQQTCCIRAIRQICSLFKKQRMLCSEKRINDALRNYRIIDDDMVGAVPMDKIDLFMDVANYVVTSTFSDFTSEDLVPKHGPGATADRINGNQKFSQNKTVWLQKFDNLVNKGEFLYNTEESEHLDSESITVEEHTYNLPCRLSYVPKTAKTPRIIALEPTTMQCIQQPIKDYLVHCMESGPITKGHVNFTDQGINRALALENSVTQHMATVDLSAASDRISSEHIYLLFSAYPKLRDALFIARSEYIEIGKGNVCRLNKFASMGSALCFPCEGFYFFILCICAIMENNNIPFSPSNVSSVAKRVYVYGDDIIVPSDEVDYLIHYMACYKAKVGLEKTFKTGLFRESCGMDAYNGTDITPVYMRNPIPSGKKDISSIVSCVSTINQLYKNGYERAAMYLKGCVEHVVGCLPTVAETSAGLGWHFGSFKTKIRLSKHLQRVEVRTLCVDVKPERDEIDGYAALMKCLLRLEKPEELDSSYPISYRRAVKFAKVSTDMKHLIRSYGFGTLTLKTRWTALA